MKGKLLKSHQAVGGWGEWRQPWGQLCPPKEQGHRCFRLQLGLLPKGSPYQAHAQSFQRSCDRKLMPLHLPTAENNTDFARALIAQQRVPDIQCNRVITTLFTVHAEQRLVKRPMCNNQAQTPVPQDKRWAFPARIHLRLTEAQDAMSALACP